MKKFYSALIAGVMTGLGGAAYLGAESREVGALLFSVGMFSALALGLPLYTGQCAGEIFSPSRQWKPLLLILFGNLLGAVLCGVLFGLSVPTGVIALQEAKLSQPFTATLIRSLFCGMMIYAGAESWRRLSHSKPLGTLLGVSAFVVAGFEHRVADTFYFSAALGQSGSFRAETLLFLTAAIIGNTLGAILLCLALPITEKSKSRAA
jgi:formate/nitrite transporter FocA (FNT family)